ERTNSSTLYRKIVFKGRMSCNPLANPGKVLSVLVIGVSVERRNDLSPKPSTLIAWGPEKRGAPRKNAPVHVKNFNFQLWSSRCPKAVSKLLQSNYLHRTFCGITAPAFADQDSCLASHMWSPFCVVTTIGRRQSRSTTGSNIFESLRRGRSPAPGL